MADNVVRFPSLKVHALVKENIDTIFNENKDIDVGLVLLQSGENINIFCTKYSVELVGALEVLKNKILQELLIPVDDDECDCE